MTSAGAITQSADAMISVAERTRDASADASSAADSLADMATGLSTIVADA